MIDITCPVCKEGRLVEGLDRRHHCGFCMRSIGVETMGARIVELEKELGEAVEQAIEAERDRNRWEALLHEAETERDLDRAARKDAEERAARRKQWVLDLQSGMFVNCVYCGHRYGPDPGTPVAMADVLKAHIATCPEHPMAHLVAAARDVLRTLDEETRDDIDFESLARALREATGEPRRNAVAELTKVLRGVGAVPYLHRPGCPMTAGADGRMLCDCGKQALGAACAEVTADAVARFHEERADAGGPDWQFHARAQSLVRKQARDLALAEKQVSATIRELVDTDDRLKRATAERDALNSVTERCMHCKRVLHNDPARPDIQCLDCYVERRAGGKANG
jgi:DNA-directed RNA polymerase subunit RPC12/RpoP